MENRFFSLIVVPDSGTEVKTSSFNFKFVLGLMAGITLLFFVCLFFIIGYHIKLSQEKDYKNAVHTNRELLTRISNARENLGSLASQLSTLQRNDKALRIINYRNYKDILPDDAMYEAGVGGHAIVDESAFDALEPGVRQDMTGLSYGITTLTNKIELQQASFSEISDRIAENREWIDNTPTIFPTPQSIRITSRFGMRVHPVTGIRHNHDAVDIGGSRGQPIIATADGEVVIAGYNSVVGRYVKIRHKFGYETLYGHLDRIDVKVGQQVRKRDQIGAMGRTGRATGVHLHYQVILNGRSQNPMNYLKR